MSSLNVPTIKDVFGEAQRKQSQGKTGQNLPSEKSCSHLQFNLLHLQFLLYIQNCSGSKTLVPREEKLQRTVEVKAHKHWDTRDNIDIRPYQHSSFWWNSSHKSLIRFYSGVHAVLSLLGAIGPRSGAGMTFESWQPTHFLRLEFRARHAEWKI